MRAGAGGYPELVNTFLTVTCVQAEIAPGDPEENTRRALLWIEKCVGVDTHPNFVVFPEYFLQGLTPENAKLAQRVDGPFGQAMSAAARKTGAFIFAGFLETSHDAEKPYNSVGIWGPDGTVGSYHKTHLYDWGEEHPDWMREAKSFLPGDKLGHFEIAGIKVGVMTCADGLVVEVPRTLAIMGADIILYPNGRSVVPEEHSEYHVAASGVPIAVCNGWGDVGVEMMSGGSRIIVPGAATSSMSSPGPGTVSARLDISGLRRYRSTYWPLRARRSMLFGNLTAGGEPHHEP